MMFLCPDSLRSELEGTLSPRNSLGFRGDILKERRDSSLRSEFQKEHAAET